MERRPVIFVAAVFGLLLLTGAAVVGQLSPAESCSDFVIQVLERVNLLCAGQGRNSACYGNSIVDVDLAPDQPAVRFEEQGDIAALRALTALRTAPLNEERTTWGASLLSVQANLPGSLPGQNAQFLLTGGAEIRNAVSLEESFVPAETSLQLTALVTTVVREAPLHESPGILAVFAGDALDADARGNGYLRVAVHEQFGWIRVDQTNADEVSVQALPDYIEGESFTPMQAFYLRTGIGRVLCAQAPSALIIQGPQNLNINIRANGADINLGSTVILKTYSLNEAAESGLVVPPNADVGGLLEVSVFDGRAIVRQQDGTPVRISEGEQSFICLGKPEGTSVEAGAIDQSVSYACGGWTEPEPIRPALRAEFAPVDGYRLNYPVSVQPKPSISGLSGHSALTMSARASLADQTGTAQSSALGANRLFELEVTVANTEAAPETAIRVNGLPPWPGIARVEVSAGRFDNGTATWLLESLLPGAQATLRLSTLLLAGCDETIFGTVHAVAFSGGEASEDYNVTARCSERLVAGRSPAPPTPVPPPSPPTSVPPAPVPPTQESMTTICHKGRETLTLPEVAVLHHLAQHADDFLGACH